MLSQDCPTGQHCLVGSKGTECVPGSGGLKTMGMKCNAGECGAGMHCLEGHCSAFCCPETNEPCGDGACDVQVSFSVGYAMMCSFNPGCLLFEGDCPKGQHCHIGDAEAGLAVCDKPSDSFVDESEVCIFRNDCGESQLCNKNGADRDGEKGRCRHLCKPSAWEKLKPSKGGCLAERTCEKANAGTFTDLGICSPVDP